MTTHEDGVPERRRREIVAEYRLVGALLVAVAVLGGAQTVLLLWVLLLAVALPVHLFTELPEHVLCDVDSSDVRLLMRHDDVRGVARSVESSYVAFYRNVLGTAWENTFRRNGTPNRTLHSP